MFTTFLEQDLGQSWSFSHQLNYYNLFIAVRYLVNNAFLDTIAYNENATVKAKQYILWTIFSRSTFANHTISKLRVTCSSTLPSVHCDPLPPPPPNGQRLWAMAVQELNIPPGQPNSEDWAECAVISIWPLCCVVHPEMFTPFAEGVSSNHQLWTTFKAFCVGVETGQGICRR